MKKNRLLEIDFIRGLAIIGMVIFHIFYASDFYGFLDLQMRSTSWNVLSRSVQFTFLTLVGISLALSSKRNKDLLLRHWRKGFMILMFGLGITIVTTLAINDLAVKFGILHLIGASILILTPFVRHKYISLAISIAALILASKIRLVTINTLPAYILGYGTTVFSAVDYFPIFPWIGLPAFGIFLGHYLYPWKSPKISPKNLIVKAGQKSLLIYIMHVPIIVSVLFLGKFLIGLI
ncbi:DUF1624 domain-containing protein [Candidatus Gracilibacteria bacterium]|nr:DUF1624 domain-containing protein [Candidatus Gracilibacteria bacterium]